MSDLQPALLKMTSAGIARDATLEAVALLAECGLKTDVYTSVFPCYGSPRGSPIWFHANKE